MPKSAAEAQALSLYRLPVATAVLVWCGVAVVSSLYVALPMNAMFAETFAVSAELAAWTSSGFSFAYAAGFLLLAPLAARYGTWRIMVAGLAVLGLVTPLIGLMDSLPGVIAMRVAQGFVAATFAPNALTYIAEVYPADKRIATIGFLSTGFLLAGIVGQVFGSLMLPAPGWPYAFYALGAAYLISAALLGLFAPASGRGGGESERLPIYRQIGALLRNKRLALLFFIALTLFLVFVGMYAALGSVLAAPPYSLDAGGIMLVRAAGIVGMALSPFTGALAARFGLPRMLKAALLGASAGLAAIGLSASLAALVVSSVVFVAGISVLIPTLVSLAGQQAGPARGAAMAMYSFILFLGATLGPLVSLRLLHAGSALIAFGALALLLLVSYACAIAATRP